MSNGILETDIEELMDFIREKKLTGEFTRWKFERKKELVK